MPTWEFPLLGPKGRAAIDLPWTGHAPYHVSVQPVGFRSEGREETRLLACPRSGCLAGYHPPGLGHAGWPLPNPVLPIRGVTEDQLTSSLRYALATASWPSVTRATCSSLRLCTVTLVTPGYPKHPYRQRYRIAGEQVPGCWMAMSSGLIDKPPYQDAGETPLELAGCTFWR